MNGLAHDPRVHVLKFCPRVTPIASVNRAWRDAVTALAHCLRGIPWQPTDAAIEARFGTDGLRRIKLYLWTGEVGPDPFGERPGPEKRPPCLYRSVVSHGNRGPHSMRQRLCIEWPFAAPDKCLAVREAVRFDAGGDSAVRSHADERRQWVGIFVNHVLILGDDGVTARFVPVPVPDEAITGRAPERVAQTLRRLRSDLEADPVARRALAPACQTMIRSAYDDCDGSLNLTRIARHIGHCHWDRCAAGSTVPRWRLFGNAAPPLASGPGVRMSFPASMGKDYVLVAADRRRADGTATPAQLFVLRDTGPSVPMDLVRVIDVPPGPYIKGFSRKVARPCVPRANCLSFVPASPRCLLIECAVCVGQPRGSGDGFHMPLYRQIQLAVAWLGAGTGGPVVRFVPYATLFSAENPLTLEQIDGRYAARNGTSSNRAWRIPPVDADPYGQPIEAAGFRI